MTEPALAVVGLIRNAQGIRGEVVVEALTDAPDAVFASGRRVFVDSSKKNEEARPMIVDTARPFKGGFIVKFEGLDDRNAAELFRGRYLLAPFDELEPLGDNEVYMHDLVGMQVSLDTGERVGEVKSYYELPQGLTLEVQTEKGTVLVPYRPEMVERTESAERRIIVKSEVGLFE
jgi:16S rRNA processing protein RimM